MTSQRKQQFNEVHESQRTVLFGISQQDVSKRPEASQGTRARTSNSLHRTSIKPTRKPPSSSEQAKRKRSPASEQRYIQFYKQKSEGKSSTLTPNQAKSISPQRRVIRQNDMKHLDHQLHGTLTPMEIAHPYNQRIIKNLGVEDQLKAKQGRRVAQQPNQLSFGQEDFSDPGLKVIKMHYGSKLQASNTINMEGANEHFGGLVQQSES